MSASSYERTLPGSKMSGRSQPKPDQRPACPSRRSLHPARLPS